MGAPVFHSKQVMGNRVEKEVKTASSTQICVTAQDGGMNDLGLKSTLETKADGSKERQ